MEETSSCNDQDRISSLPVALIHHILSFLDMKLVVQTSVLSRRWSDVWISLPFLNLNCVIDVDSSVDRSRLLDGFIDFVDKVFILRDNSDIKRLRLFIEDCEGCGELPTHLNRWILAALRRSVQELDLEMDVKHYSVCKLPHQLFSCRTLRKLKIKMGGTEYTDITIPRSVGLPNLNSLSISGLIISNVEFAKSLISSFPLLELTIVDSKIHTENNQALTIDSRDLQSFRFDTNHAHILCPDKETLPIVIKLNAPNLISLSCKDFMARDYSLLENLSSLATANITRVLKENETRETYLELPAEEKDMFGKRMMKILGALYNVKELRLSCGFLEVLSDEPSLLISQPRQYCNLQHLELEMWFTRGCLRSIAYLLNISPNLKSLVLVSNEENLPEVGDDWDAGLTLPSMLCHLKYVEIREVEGSDNEVKFLRILLTKAMVLEEVALFFRSTVGSPDRVTQLKRFRDKLRVVPRASSSINMFFF